MWDEIKIRTQQSARKAAAWFLEDPNRRQQYIDKIKEIVNLFKEDGRDALVDECVLADSEPAIFTVVPSLETSASLVEEYLMVLPGILSAIASVIQHMSVGDLAPNNARNAMGDTCFKSPITSTVGSRSSI